MEIMYLILLFAHIFALVIWVSGKNIILPLESPTVLLPDRWETCDGLGQLHTFGQAIQHYLCCASESFSTSHFLKPLIES